MSDAHLDIKTIGFWCRGQDAYFDVRVFYPNASSYHSLSLISVMRMPNVSMVNIFEHGGLHSIGVYLHW